MDKATLDNAVASVSVLGGGAAFNYPLANTRWVVQVRLFLVDSEQPLPYFEDNHWQWVLCDETRRILLDTSNEHIPKIYKRSTWYECPF